MTLFYASSEFEPKIVVVKGNVQRITYYILCRKETHDTCVLKVYFT